MTSHSFSQLDAARFCGQAPVLAKAQGAGRAAAMSKARHAAMAGDLDAKQLALSLTDGEIEEVQTWRAPEPFNVDGRELVYEQARTEWKVGLSRDLGYCDYEDPDRLTRGIVDMAWGPIEVGGVRTAVVADAKKSRFTSSANSLQLAAGGLAVASHWGCDVVRLGLWILEDAQWAWGPTLDTYSMQAAAAGELIGHAATNDGDFNTGPHCDTFCYARLRCPEYLFPPSMAETELLPFVDGYEPDTALEAAELLLKATRAKKTAEQVIKNVQAYAADRGGLRRGEQVYRAVNMPGRRTVKLAVLDDDEIGDKAKRYMTKGKGFQQWRWSKVLP